MKKFTDKKNPLLRDGTSRFQRMPNALDPSFVKIDGRSRDDLIDYLYDYAGLLRFYDAGNQVDGNWEELLDLLKKYAADENVLVEGMLPPHQALLLAFLKLYGIVQEDLNDLTAKHLDFYYKEVLRLLESPPNPDQVHLLFELAKTASPTLLKPGTLLKAGKDSSGKELVYGLDEDIIVNKASIGLLKSVYVDPLKPGRICKGDPVNSVDGLGEALPEDDPNWPAFGSSTFPEADIGFAIASPMLWLQEGERTITSRILLNDGSLNIPDDVLQNSFKVWLSGEKEWLGPYTLSPTIKSVDEGTQLSFKLVLSSGEDAVSFFNHEVLDGGFETIYPVMKVLLNPDASNSIYPYLQGAGIGHIKISVNVTGIESLVLENDQGVLNADKPFLPFGPTPVKRSGFYIGCEEAFTKPIDGFSLDVNWQDVPASNLRSYYGSSYSGDNAFLNYSLGSNAFKAELTYRKREGTISSKTVNLFNSTSNQSNVKWEVGDKGLIYNMLPVFQVQMAVSSLANKQLSPMFQKKLNILPQQPLVFTGLAGFLSTIKKSLDSGYVKLELLHDFLHKAYQQKYTQAVAKFSKNYLDTDLELPFEPYTPKIKSVTLNYDASTSEVDLSSEDEDSFTIKEAELFQIGAFGQREVHAYLQAQSPLENNEGILLLPDFSNEGNLYLGIKDINPLQTLNLLIQVAEGSANPETDQQEVNWSILVDEHWMLLDDKHLLADNTNGLLQSGVVKIYIPSSASSDNNWIDTSYTWLRASIGEQTDAVCKITGIHAQAVTATFKDQGNSADHLAVALAAKSLAKLKNPLAAIKKVAQPYASFGGRMKENSEAFYTRVSERLRHKNRAVNIYDYERLVLETFPGIHKVKCLNHTSAVSEMAPGHINLVLVPDLSNQNAVNKLEPKVSKATLSNVKSFVEGLAPGLIEVHTSNPAYERIKLDFSVRFKKNYEFGFYKDQLNQDIIDFLSPWATNKSKDISFGGRIHKSVLLKFVEDREYVDFLTEFKMYHQQSLSDPGIEKEEISASSSRAILVSDSSHNINNYQEVEA